MLVKSPNRSRPVIGQGSSPSPPVILQVCWDGNLGSDLICEVLFPQEHGKKLAICKFAAIPSKHDTMPGQMWHTLRAHAHTAAPHGATSFAMCYS